MDKANERVRADEMVSSLLKIREKRKRGREEEGGRGGRERDRPTGRESDSMTERSLKYYRDKKGRL